MTTKPELHKILKGILLTEERWWQTLESRKEKKSMRGIDLNTKWELENNQAWPTQKQQTPNVNKGERKEQTLFDPTKKTSNKITRFTHLL